MLTENIYNYRMEYPGVYVPSLPVPSYHPITPPYTHPYDNCPVTSGSVSSAFSSVGSSQTTKLDHKLSASALRNPELLSMYQSPSYYPYYRPNMTPHYPLSPPESSASYSSPTSPSSAASQSPPLIQRLLQRHRSTTMTTETDDDDVIFVDDVNDNVNTATSPNNPVANRTSVIMKIDERKFNDVVSKSMRSDPTNSSNKISPSDEEIICKWESCFRLFDSLEQLASHVTHTHAIASMGGLYYCQWHLCPRADRGFNARYKMLVHVRTHTKEKPHQCQQCEKSFSRAENLKIHTRSHSGEKPYACPVDGCTKAYSNSSDRFKHTRTHSTEKPYFCKVAGCNKRYTDPSSLRKHVKTFKHTANLITFDEMVKPYQQQQLKQHQHDYRQMHQHHSDGYQPDHHEFGYHHNDEENQNHQHSRYFRKEEPLALKCNCSHVECYENLKHTEIHKLGHLLENNVSIESTDVESHQHIVAAAPYLGHKKDWIESNRGFEFSLEEEQDDAVPEDMPLDLSIVKSGRYK